MNNFLHPQNSTGPGSSLDDFNRSIKEEEAMALAKDYDLPYINLRNFPIDLNVLGMMHEEDARQTQSVIFYRDKSDVRVATINPQNSFLKQKIAELSDKYTVTLYVASSLSMEGIYKFYEKVTQKPLSRDETIRAGNTNLEKAFTDLTPEKQASISQTELLPLLFGRAAQVGASDIHLEPEGKFLKVRFRIDGVLQEVLRLNKELQKPITNRLKISAKLKLNVDTIPQDGRLTFYYENEPIDVRVSSLPSAYGESFVMRLLTTHGLTVEINQLGLEGKAWEVVQRQLAKPNGMIITTGPTGSGKTTTLYSFIKTLNKPGVKIITIEDPVEYKIDDIVQTPIDHSVDFSFAKALRAILRQDPDIVMVGEIRDEETAETAAQAALTGHIVLSTLHTNDAAGAVPRLYNMGVKPFVLAPALNCVIAQRLVRKLCEACKGEEKLDEVLLAKVKKIIESVPENSGRTVPGDFKLYDAKGCAQCGNVGYKGRIGLFEVIEVDDDMEDFIQKEPTMVEIKKKSVEAGMVTLLQDGMLKALAGITDIKEVFRVAGE